MMMRLLVLALCFATPSVWAACTTVGDILQCTGTGTNDDDVLFTSGSVMRYRACSLVSSVGAVDVQISMDGTDFVSAALSLEDFGATTTDPVVVTAADRTFAFANLGYMKIRVLQNGATGATAIMNCVLR